jgi:tRNA-(ms[2]io[6]A)-hydroxylase
MTIMTDIEPLLEFLPCETPDSWIETALQNPEIMLIDHANCELKAAQSAQALIWKYGTNQQGLKDVDIFDLLNKMSKLAREELRHFEQVLAIMNSRKVAYTLLSASRYAAQLRKMVRTSEPEKLIDTLIIGAFIEARSCERFAKLAPFLDSELKKFYLSLLKSEARHYEDYLSLATKAAGGISLEDRIQVIRAKEQELIESPDTELRFHSGPVVFV